jgi:hypothetical protein
MCILYVCIYRLLTWLGCYCRLSSPCMPVSNFFFLGCYYFSFLSFFALFLLIPFLVHVVFLSIYMYNASKFLLILLPFSFIMFPFTFCSDFPISLLLREQGVSCWLSGSIFQLLLPFLFTTEHIFYTIIHHTDEWCLEHVQACLICALGTCRPWAQGAGDVRSAWKVYSSHEKKEKRYIILGRGGG